MMELTPAKGPLKRLRDHDYYWFIGPDRPFIAELIGEDWHLPGEAKAQTTEQMEEQGLHRWRRVQFPVDMRDHYGIPKGYGREDRMKYKPKNVDRKKRRKKRNGKGFGV